MRETPGLKPWRRRQPRLTPPFDDSGTDVSALEWAARYLCGRWAGGMRRAHRDSCSPLERVSSRIVAIAKTAARGLSAALCLALPAWLVSTVDEGHVKATRLAAAWRTRLRAMIRLCVMTRYAGTLCRDRFRLRNTIKRPPARVHQFLAISCEPRDGQITC